MVGHTVGVGHLKVKVFQFCREETEAQDNEGTCPVVVFSLGYSRSRIQYLGVEDTLVIMSHMWVLPL